MIRLLEIPSSDIGKLCLLETSISESSKVDTRAATFPLSGTCHAWRSTLSQNEKLSLPAYLRAAHAYMLISMPTGTSTIFGVFQAILALLVVKRTISALTAR